MLEYLALEDSCIYSAWNWIYSAWNWIYENWSWGLFVAVLSLWFTAGALKKTEESNRLSGESLALTKRSTDIAERSLRAAKRSISTSVKIYEKQKKDNDALNQNARISLGKAIIDVCGKEAFLMLQYIIFILDIRNLKGVALSVNKEMTEAALWKVIYFNTTNNEICRVHCVPKDLSYLSHDILVKSAEVDINLFGIISNLNDQIHVINLNVKKIIHYIENNEINALMDYINYYMPLDGKNFFIKGMLDDIFKFDLPMKDYNGYSEVMDKIKPLL
ncbi:hypothetical protein KMU_13920 [Proteus vulgaris]|uniref:hypothetical protein n=1 Tax=Proteus vulgaris TaxID=585 RepID=UPI002555179F|nr:hypothetical protein [Proteus vulgaris]GLX63351.1 hypothetical protein KMU_13920 [Proteus vulgaris]